MADSNLKNKHECAICVETFLRPRSLPCGHSFCGSPRGCISRVLKERAECPVCRAKFSVEDNYPLNWELISAIMGSPGVVNDQQKLELHSEKCQRHNLDRLYFCKNCETNFCQDCWDMDHKDHSIVLFSAYKKEYVSSEEFVKWNFKGDRKSLNETISKASDIADKLLEENKGFENQKTKIESAKSYEEFKEFVDTYKGSGAKIVKLMDDLKGVVNKACVGMETITGTFNEKEPIKLKAFQTGELNGCCKKVVVDSKGTIFALMESGIARIELKDGKVMLNSSSQNLIVCDIAVAKGSLYGVVKKAETKYSLWLYYKNMLTAAREVDAKPVKNKFLWQIAGNDQNLAIYSNGENKIFIFHDEKVINTISLFSGRVPKRIEFGLLSQGEYLFFKAPGSFDFEIVLQWNQLVPVGVGSIDVSQQMERTPQPIWATFYLSEDTANNVATVHGLSAPPNGIATGKLIVYKCCSIGVSSDSLFDYSNKEKATIEDQVFNAEDRHVYPLLNVGYNSVLCTVYQKRSEKTKLYWLSPVTPSQRKSVRMEH